MFTTISRPHLQMQGGYHKFESTACDVHNNSTLLDEAYEVMVMKPSPPYLVLAKVHTYMVYEQWKTLPLFLVFLDGGVIAE